MSASPIEAQQAFDHRRRGWSTTARKVVNGITVRGRDQVMLKVTVAEVQRDVIKQLGIDLTGTLGYGSSVLNFNNANPFPVGRPAAGQHQRHHRHACSGDQRDAARDGARRRDPHAGRAEPDRDLRRNRQLPGRRRIPDSRRASPAIPTTRNCQTQIQFKKFGVGLNFTPVVLSEGRISLKVLTEVSELSTENALTLTQSIGIGQTRR